jgi:cobalt-zinc-cadmium efflux system outer membrane protein
MAKRMEPFLRRAWWGCGAVLGLLVGAGGCSQFPGLPATLARDAAPNPRTAPRPAPVDQRASDALREPAPRRVTLGGPQAIDPLDGPIEQVSGEEKAATLPEPVGLTLDQSINTALLADPKIRAGLEIINQANADLLTSSLLPNPTYSGDIQLLPLVRPFVVTRQGGPPQTDHQIAFPIDWFLFGKRAAAMASAAAGVRVSEADYADLVRTRVTDVAVAFYDLLEARALVALARQDLDNLRRVQAGTEKGLKAGGRSVVDLNRVRLDVLRSEQTLREAETAVIGAMARLRARLGRKDADPAFAVSGTLDAALTAEPLPVEEALAVAEHNRPDIQSLRLQIARAGSDIRTEQKKACPTVTPLLGYTHQYQFRAIGFPDADSWMAALSMSLPVFDRNQGNIAKAQSVLAQNTHNLETGLADLRAEIVQVVREFQAAHQTAREVADKQLRTATEVRDSITKSFEAGGQTLLDVLDAQRTYRETYRLYITSRAAYWRAAYRFHSAIGKQDLHHDEHLPRQPGRAGP